MPPCVPQRASKKLLATMVTTTTWGTWLPGDLRGYVDNGMILPGDPQLLERSRNLLAVDPVLLNPSDQEQAFHAIQRAADEFHYKLIAVSIESWHAHWLIDHGFDAVEVMVGRLKTRMRQALNRGRIWTEGYDARLCFEAGLVDRRRDYIRGHGGWRPLPHEISAPRS